MYKKGRKRKFNKYERPIDAELDLHGYRVREAQALFELFIAEALKTGQDRLRVVTGRGMHSADGRARIKPMVVDILKAHGMKYREGKPDEGGEGVVIIDL